MRVALMATHRRALHAALLLKPRFNIILSGFIAGKYDLLLSVIRSFAMNNTIPIRLRLAFLGILECNEFAIESSVVIIPDEWRHFCKSVKSRLDVSNICIETITFERVQVDDAMLLLVILEEGHHRITTVCMRDMYLVRDSYLCSRQRAIKFRLECTPLLNLTHLDIAFRKLHCMGDHATSIDCGWESISTIAPNLDTLKVACPNTHDYDCDHWHANPAYRVDPQTDPQADLTVAVFLSPVAKCAKLRDLTLCGKDIIYRLDTVFDATRQEELRNVTVIMHSIHTIIPSFESGKSIPQTTLGRLEQLVLADLDFDDCDDDAMYDQNSNSKWSIMRERINKTRAHPDYAEHVKKALYVFSFDENSWRRRRSSICSNEIYSIAYYLPDFTMCHVDEIALKYDYFDETLEEQLEEELDPAEEQANAITRATRELLAERLRVSNVFSCDLINIGFGEDVCTMSSFHKQIYTNLMSSLRTRAGTNTDMKLRVDLDIYNITKSDGHDEEEIKRSLQYVFDVSVSKRITLYSFCNAHKDVVSILRGVPTLFENVYIEEVELLLDTDEFDDTDDLSAFVSEWIRKSSGAQSQMRLHTITVNTSHLDRENKRHRNMLKFEVADALDTLQQM